MSASPTLSQDPEGANCAAAGDGTNSFAVDDSRKELDRIVGSRGRNEDCVSPGGDSAGGLGPSMATACGTNSCATATAGVNDDMQTFFSEDGSETSRS